MLKKDLHTHSCVGMGIVEPNVSLVYYAQLFWMDAHVTFTR